MYPIMQIKSAFGEFARIALRFIRGCIGGFAGLGVIRGVVRLVLFPLCDRGCVVVGLVCVLATASGEG